MSRCNGVVLLIVLVYTHMLAVLGLFALKLSHAMASQLRIESTLMLEEISARQILRRIQLLNVNCMITPASLIQFRRYNLSWWQQNACSGNLEKQKYYFIVEDLGLDHCALIENILLKQVLAAHYYRVTLYLGSGDEWRGRLWQASFALPHAELFACNENVRYVTKGQQWVRSVY